MTHSKEVQYLPLLHALAWPHANHEENILSVLNIMILNIPYWGKHNKDLHISYQPPE